VVELELQDVFCFDIDDLATWRPEGNHIDYSLELRIGAVGQVGAHDFHVRVVDEQTIAAEPGRARQYALIVDVESYAYDSVIASLTAMIATCCESTWADSVDKLRAVFHWEYEGYR